MKKLLVCVAFVCVFGCYVGDFGFQENSGGFVCRPSLSGQYAEKKIKDAWVFATACDVSGLSEINTAICKSSCGVEYKCGIDEEKKFVYSKIYGCSVCEWTLAIDGQAGDLSFDEERIIESVCDN